MTIQELDRLVSRIEFALEHEDYQRINDDLLKMVGATRQLIDALSKLELNT